MSRDATARHIPPGACTWCGHNPHGDACPATIRTGKTTTDPCPCTRHAWKGVRDELV